MPFVAMRVLVSVIMFIETDGTFRGREKGLLEGVKDGF
jgi:hypothetical protein